MTLIILILIFLFTVVFHELAHGVVAYKLGDSTAKDAGRLTLNPLKHIDPIWTILVPGVLFISTGGRFAIGMAKPVPVNISQLRHPKRDMIWVAAAGPLANLIFAAILSFFAHQSGHVYLLYGIYFNLGLAAFNLLPIPPLDGSKMLAGILPNKAAVALLKFERYGFLVILGLYFAGILFYFIVPMMNFFCKMLHVPILGL